MTQKEVVKNKAGEIQLKDSTISLTDDNEILTINLKNDSNNFFVKHKHADVHISFSYNGDITITAYQDKDETEIKNLKFESMTKNKKLKIKLNKLLDGVQIQDR